MKKFALIFITLLFLASCARKPSGVFDIRRLPTEPDYSSLDSWGAHPDKEDPSDRVPDGIGKVKGEILADVFFIHPTTYTGREMGQNQWNASLSDGRLNRKTNNTTILLQSSAFNGVGPVWAPRYRQAHLKAFFTKDTTTAKKALDLAYRDVKKAFETFLKTRPDPERPIIIAAHSQGAFHGRRLIREVFDGSPMSEKLVAAYLAGYRVPKDMFEMISPCRGPDDTGCLTSWRTFKKGYKPEWLEKEDGIIVTNPLTWTNTPEWVPNTENEGGVYTTLDPVRKNWVGAGIHQTILWSDKPRFPCSFLLFSRNYHAGDINLFYMNIRNNAIERARQWHRESAMKQ